MTGVVRNAPAAQEPAIVSSTTEYGGAQQVTNFRVTTPRNTAASVYALHKVTTASSNWDYENEVRGGERAFEPPTTDLVLDVDLQTNAVALTSVEGTFELPERSSSPVRADSTLPVVVGYRGSSYWHHPVGWTARLMRSGAQAVYTHQTPVDSAAGPNWYRVELRTEAGPWSVIYGRGLAEGAQGRALDIPTWSERRSQAIEDEVAWEVFDDDVTQQLWILNDATDEVMWIVNIPLTQRALTLPTLPSGVTRQALLGTRARAVVATLRALDSDVGAFLAASWSEGRFLEL